MSKIIIPPPLTKEEQRELNLLLNHINRASSVLDYVFESDSNIYNFNRIKILQAKKAERKEFITSFFSPN